MDDPSRLPVNDFGVKSIQSRYDSPIFLLAGAPAVGKSSTARSLAARFQKSLHIPVDDLREMVVSGLSLPGNWDDPLIEQLRLARESAVHMGMKYSRAGFAVVMDDFWDPNSRLQEYHELFPLPNFHKILLVPSEEVAHTRNLKRAGEGDSSLYIAAGIRIVYADLASQVPGLERQGWLVVDTTDKGIEATVSYILEKVGDTAPQE